MDPLRFRPGVEPLADRVTPAVTPAQVFDAFTATTNDLIVLRDLTDTIGEYRSPATRAALATSLRATADREIGAAGVLSEFLGGLTAAAPGTVPAGVAGAVAGRLQLAQTLGAYAELFASAFGAPPRVPPAPPAPPAPPPPATDGSALSATLPPLDDPRFRDVGNGLRTLDVVQGTGDVARIGDDVSVQYRGFLASNGAVFDDSVRRGTPQTFTLGRGPNGVIEGFAQGIAGMQVGGIRRIDIPPELGYGAVGNPPGLPPNLQSVPPNSRLVFEVQLLDTTPPA